MHGPINKRNHNYYDGYIINTESYRIGNMHMEIEQVSEKLTEESR